MSARQSFIRKLFGATSQKQHAAHPSSEAFSWRKFGRHYLKAIVWIVMLTAIVHVMEVSGVLKGFEMAGLDTFLRLHGRDMSKRVVIVEITDEDYKDPQLFDGKSPLNNEKLVQLVSRVREYRPAAIGMDFDTSSPEWCRENQSTLAEMLPPPSASAKTAGHSPIVWAEIPDIVEENLKLAPVLGGRLRDLDYVGVPRFPVDSDGLVRRYESEFRVNGTLEDCPRQFPARAKDASQRERSSEISPMQGSEGNEAANPPSSMASFARAVLHHACEDPKLDCSVVRQELNRPVIFNFYGDRYRFPIIQAHEFIGPSAETPMKDQTIRDHRAAVLRDKIVLIGGNFNAARDVYMTPLGEMAGVELIALAVESDFGGGIRETRKWLEKLADFLVGSLIVLVYFYYRRRPRFALFVSLVGIPVVAMAFSLLLFRTAAYWFNFMPIIIGMVLHQMLELSESCGELQEEVRELEHKLQAFRATTLQPEALQEQRAELAAPIKENDLHPEEPQPPAGEPKK